MGTLPTLSVLLDNGTGTFPINITSSVMGLDGYEISRGRDDWQSAVTAGELTLTLNNSDGRFTPGSTILGTPSPIKVDQRIRIVETIGASAGSGGFGVIPFGTGGFGGAASGAATHTRFTGYVKSWPVDWPAVVTTFSRVRLTATDAQARAERQTLRSIIEEEILVDHPVAYYTFGEKAGSTSAGDTSNNAELPLTVTGTGAAVVFGSAVGPPTDNLTALRLANGKFMTVRFKTGYTLAAVEMWASSTSAAATNQILLATGTSTTFIYQTPSGAMSTPGATSTGWTTDGALHHLVWVAGDGTYLDGTFTAGASSPVPVSAVHVGGFPIPFTGTTGWTGTIAHLALYVTAPSGARIVSHFTAASPAPEAGTTRLARLASYSSIPLGTLDSSLTNVTFRDWTGSSVMSELQATVDAEFGSAYVDGFGSLTFHNRNRVVSKTAPDITLDRQWVTPDVQPVVDDQQIVNYVEATAAGGSGSAMVVGDSTSQTSHGRYPSSRDYLVQTDAEAKDRAGWLVANLAEPSPRYGTLTINLFGMTEALASTVLGAIDVDAWLRVTSMASQNPGGTTVDVIVQGWRETVTAESWTITCNVVSRTPFYAPAWILGTSTLGVDTRLYV